MTDSERAIRPSRDDTRRCLDVSGTLTDRDRQTRRVFQAIVPPGTLRLTIGFTYGPGEIGQLHNLVTISVFDPDGFRGAAHRWVQVQLITIGEWRATAGFLPGAIPAGVWRVEVDAHEVLDDRGNGCSYAVVMDATVRAVPTEGSQESAATRAQTADHRINTTRGWYRGDLHSHSVHCDGSSTIDEMAAAAVDRGLDFLATTGHNTISEWTVPGAWPSGLLRVRGVECTTFFGHANVLGTSAWIDWRVPSPDAGAKSILAQAAAQGAFAVVNHPRALGNPVCTGCHWDYPIADIDGFDAIEVWNSRWSEPDVGNVDALGLWTERLMTGRRITAISGTDSHAASDYLRDGLPFTWVYADGLAERDILEGLRRGRAYLSSGPRIRLRAQAASQDQAIIPGDHLPRGSFELGVIVEELSAPAELWIVADGNGRRLGVLEAPVSSVDAGVTAERWWRLEVRSGGAHEELIALTNPVYHSADSPE